MKIIPVLILVFFVKNSQCDLLQLANPLWWINKITGREFTPLPPLILTTTTEPPPVLSTVESLFNLAPELQSILDVEDPIAKTNYIISPLASAILLSNILLASKGIHYNNIVGILKLQQHASKKLHMNFLIDLHDIKREIAKDVDSYEFSMKGAFFFKNEADLSDHFLASTIRFFQTDIVGTDFTDTDESYRNADHWLSRYTSDRITRVPDGSITGLTESLMYEALVFETRWQFVFRRLSRKEFNVKPFKQIKIAYYEGIIYGAQYVNNDKYTVVAIPDTNRKVWLYIVLPKGDDWVKYEIRAFSEKLDYNDLNIIENSYSVEDIKVKIPEILFPVNLTVDNLKPVINYKNSENLQYSLPPSDDLRLDETGLNLSGAYQFLYFDINVTNPINIPERNVTNRQIPDKFFEVDRPFVFFLKHKETRAVLLWGSISDPSKLDKSRSV